MTLEQKIEEVDKLAKELGIDKKDFAIQRFGDDWNVSVRTDVNNYEKLRDGGFVIMRQ